MDKKLTNLLVIPFKDLELLNKIMDIGAGQDTARLARFVPAAMIFIPC